MTSLGNKRVFGALGTFGALLLFSVSSAAGPLKLGAGLMGIAGGNFQDKPDRSALEPDVNPGFGGLTIGGGLMLDSRLFDLIGVEVDVIRSSDHGKGTVSFNGASNKVTIGQGAWHIPILAKLTLPSPLIAPQIFLGPEIVAPSKASVSVDPSAADPFFAQKADTYVMFTFGAGIEIKLPLPILDLRIPIGIRGSYGPGVPSSFAERTTIGPPLTYNSEWKFAVNATVGAALYF